MGAAAQVTESELPAVLALAHGVTGNGTTDDASALNTLLQEGRRIWLPQTGSAYLIKETLTFATNATLACEPGVTISNLSTNPSIAASGTNSQIRDCSFSGISGTSSASSVVAGSNSFTGSISGSVLTVTAINTGTIYPGTTIGATTVAPGTEIVSQTSGTTGGIGTYNVSASQSVASGPITGTYGLLTVGGTVTGAFAVGGLINGAGVVPGTSITASGTGSGGAGTYIVNNNFGVSNNTSISTTPYNNSNTPALGTVSGNGFQWMGGGANGMGSLFIQGQNDQIRHALFQNGSSTAITLEGAASPQVLYSEFENNFGFGIGTQLPNTGIGTSLGRLIGNWTNGNKLELIGLGYSASGFLIQGNSSTYTGDNGISLTGSNNVVTGNFVSHCAYSGIAAEGADQTVTGNVVTDCGQVHNTASPWYNASNGNLYGGITVSAGFGGAGQYQVVSGNHIYDDQSTGNKTQAYGIKIDLGYPVWQSGAMVGAGEYVYSGGNIYVNTAGTGTAGSTAPTCTGYRSTCSDGIGGITWGYISTSPFPSNLPIYNFISGNQVRGSATSDYYDANTNDQNSIISQAPGTNGVNWASGLIGGFVNSVNGLTGGAVADYQCTSFTTPGSTSWPKPSWLTGANDTIEVDVVGSGGGGGAGGTSSTAAVSGGAGGGGGFHRRAVMLASQMPTSVTLTVAQGGTAGMGGSAAGNGNISNFGSSTQAIDISAYGGGFGAAGTTSGATGGGAAGSIGGGNGSIGGFGGSPSGGAGIAGTSVSQVISGFPSAGGGTPQGAAGGWSGYTYDAPSGGSGGGGIASGTGFASGNVGRPNSTAVISGVSGAGNSAPANEGGIAGSGGVGGGGNASGAGYIGGPGGVGAGGGGGGAGTTSGGSGGAGGNGLVRVCVRHSA